MQQHQPGGEANLVIPDLNSVQFLGMGGRSLLMWGILVCFAGLLFALVIYGRLKRMPVHSSMLEISELIYETCKTYLITQGKFILVLWVFIGIIAGIYFGKLAATLLMRSRYGCCVLIRRSKLRIVSSVCSSTVYLW